MKEDLKATGVYIATLVGAGFASGSEIVHYFVRYGKFSFFAIAFASFLFGFFAITILEFSKKINVDSFSYFIDGVFGDRLGKYIKILISFFIFAVFSAMISGSASSLLSAFGLKRAYGALITCGLVFAVLIFDFKGLANIDTAISILIFIGIIAITSYLYTSREISVFKNEISSLLSGAKYAGYNMLTAGGVLTGFSKKVSNTKRVGVLSGISVFILLLFLWGIISIYHGKIPLGEIPMLTICKRHGDVIYYSYFIVLLLAMFSTAISNAYLLVDAKGNNRILSLLGVVILGFFLSGFSLDFFVGEVYAATGFWGILIMIIICLKNIRKI